MMQDENEVIDYRSVKACHECDLLQHIPDLNDGEIAYCQRCGAVLQRFQKNSLDTSLALAITGLILFMVANLFPLISLKALGVAQHGTLISSTWALFDARMPFLGMLLLFTTILFPLFTLLGTIYVLLAVRINHLPAIIAPLFRFLRSTDAWGMLEIFLLALIVSAVKLVDITEVVIGVSLYAFVLLIVTLTVLSTTLNPDDIWNPLKKRAS